MKASTAIILCLLGLTYAMDTSSCSTWTCGDSVSGTGSCLVVSGNAVTVHACSSGYECEGLNYFGDYNDPETSVCFAVGGTSTTTCPDDILLGTYDYCCEDSDCASLSCSSNHCDSLPTDSVCVDSDECKPSQYCTTGLVCADLFSSGDVCIADEECPIGYGCNFLICTKLWSLTTGEASEDDKYCQSNYVNIDSKCDSFSVYSGSTVLASPFVCTIGSTCTYKYDNLGTSETVACQCAGNGSTSGYCAPIGATTGWDNVIFPKIQYSDSDCAGDNAHSGDPTVLNACNAISNDALDYITQLGMVENDWSLYHSGAINSCAKAAGAFDPSYDLSSYSGAEILAVSALVALFY